MLVIQYLKNKGGGGLGDRIVGLISIKLMSKLLKKDFYILWERENIKQYFDYQKYDFSLLNIKSKDSKTYRSMDRQKKFKDYLMNSTDLFTEEISFFSLNQEISQYLYKNKLFQEHNYIQDILNEYKIIYTDILKPTNYLLEKVNKLILDKRNIVGIQIRCGDCYMNSNSSHVTDNDTDIHSKLLNIKNLCESKFDNDYNIFFTTDNLKILDDINSMFGESRVIYNNDIIQHIDKNAVDSDISKVFVDNYILSQKTDLLIICVNSNYGRLAALTSNHDQLYSFTTLDILDRKTLLSKHENLFI
tara:strand:- start:614 stop:1522 length:909 start_codon:yes stop_codon:yes gene_type:complete